MEGGETARMERLFVQPNTFICSAFDHPSCGWEAVWQRSDEINRQAINLLNNDRISPRLLMPLLQPPLNDPPGRQ